MHTLQFEQFAKYRLSAPGTGVTVVRASPGSRSSGLLPVLAGAAALVCLVRLRPEFCADHAFALSLLVCLVLGSLSLRRSERDSRRLICDGRWLGASSWLLGSVVDLDELAAVDSGRGRSGPQPRELALRARDRTLLRLDLRLWRQDEVRNLLARLRQARPGLELDLPTRLWLEQRPAR
jgi:hypothetical protein